MKELVTFADLLEQDLYNLQVNISKYTIQKMADDLSKECEHAIDMFYAQYNPEDPSIHNGRVYYYRHWNFKKCSYKRYYRNHEPRFIGGVEFLMDSFPDVYKGRSSSPKEVFGRVYYLGWHGIASGQGLTPIMDPSPMKLIMRKYDEIYKNKDRYFNSAVQKALKHNYNIIA